MKSAPLGLARGREQSLATEALPVDGDRMTALIHYNRQRLKKINFFAKKPLPRSLFQQSCSNAVHETTSTSMNTHATTGHVTSFG